MCHYPPYQRLPLLCHRERRPLRRASDGNCIIVDCSTTSDRQAVQQPTMTQVPQLFATSTAAGSHIRVALSSQVRLSRAVHKTHTQALVRPCVCLLWRCIVSTVFCVLQNIVKKHRCRWFLSDPGVPGPIFVSGCLSVCPSQTN